METARITLKTQMWKNDFRQTFSEIQEAKTLDQAKQAARGCIGVWEDDDFPNQEEALEWAAHCFSIDAAQLRQYVTTKDKDCTERFVGRIAEAFFAINNEQPQLMEDDDEDDPKGKGELDEGDNEEHPMEDDDDEGGPMEEDKADAKGKEELEEGDDEDEQPEEDEEDPEQPEEEDDDEGGPMEEDDNEVIQGLAELISDQSKVSNKKAKTAIEAYLQNCKETVSQADLFAAAAIAVSFEQGDKKPATADDTLAAMSALRKMRKNPKKRTRDGSDDEEEEKVGPEPETKAPDTLDNDQIPAFLDKLDASIDKTGVQEEQAGGMIPVATTTTDLCEQINNQMGEQTIHRHTAAYRKAVFEGCLIRVCRLDQVPLATVAQQLGVHPKDPSIIFACKLYELIFEHRAHRFLQVRPANKTILATFKKHIRAILRYLQEHPNELARWTGEPHPVQEMRVTNQKGDQVNVFDTSNLF